MPCLTWLRRLATLSTRNSVRGRWVGRRVHAGDAVAVAVILAFALPLITAVWVRRESLSFVTVPPLISSSVLQISHRMRDWFANVPS